ncbi:PREDICTED: uncharacterized protein LOC106922565 [Poecilia mexicana]|uniref:uncharacterized protein LOC106922565 n=1 Tax=Poecilia mexicana TaxID=48701 RepID=UPI00072EC7A0|nr:PREDICTED: uncharacterized protein LOC106922565 [Poecilia mexicana]
MHEQPVSGRQRLGAKGVHCSGVTGWLREESREQEISSCAGIRSPGAKRLFQIHTQTRQQTRFVMETNQNKSMRRTRRNSQSLLQDPYYREVPGGHRDTPIPGKPRDAKMIHSIASLIRAKSKLLLLENPDTVEIYKLKDPTADTRKSTRGDLYLPAISKKAPSLNSLSRALSQSCPYLYDKRRGSFSSVTSQRTRVHTEKQVK